MKIFFVDYELIMILYAVQKNLQKIDVLLKSKEIYYKFWLLLLLFKKPLKLNFAYLIMNIGGKLQKL